jgi:methyltransferase-like protein
MQFLAEASSEDSIYSFELRSQMHRIDDIDDRVLFHDDLSDVATPFFLHQVAEDAAKHGLQYLSDSAFSMSYSGRLSAKTRDWLANIPLTEAVIREQYIDFVDGRAFRESLFCHASIRLVRNIDPRRMTRLYLATSALASEDDIAPAAPGVVTFKTENGSTLSTDHRLSKAVIRILGKRWPESMSFEDVLALALAELGAAGEHVKANLEDEVGALSDLLFRAFSAGQFLLRYAPVRLTTTISERPTSSLLARREAEARLVVTNLLHRGVSMKDDTVRQFLMHVDGTRTVDQLVMDLNAALARTSADDAAPDVTREGVLRNLGLLAKLGLLVA